MRGIDNVDGIHIGRHLELPQWNHTVLEHGFEVLIGHLEMVNAQYPDQQHQSPQQSGHQING